MNILLVEPAYKNKYPPLGLMKLGTYFKNKKHNVLFVKGINRNLPHEYYDKIFITTLFTFYFDMTVETIRFYKKHVKQIKDIYVGGILATLMPKELKKATGVENIIQGLLSNSKKINFKDKVNIDCLTPDYEILKQTDYLYPAGDNYFAYTTRGCPNKCPFCAVPKLEPKFKTTNNIFEQIKNVDYLYGAKRNLLLLDNNILHSPDLNEIVEDIKKAGFTLKPNYVEPLQYEIFLKRYENNPTNIINTQNVLQSLIDFIPRIKDTRKSKTFLEYINSIKKSKNVANKLLSLKGKVLPLLEKYRSKAKKQRYVDFNQGIDARLMTKEKVKILSQIPIRPLRIAFDSWHSRRYYKAAMILAKKYGFKEISNYMLYNFYDRPEDLFKRIQLNTRLRERLDIHIFSFPMKYSPVNETNRHYIGKYWNKKFIRAVQAILLVKKGIVSSQKDFVEKAFGSNVKEFFEILMMPEDYIIYRFYFEKNGMKMQWKKIFDKLTTKEKHTLLQIILDNNINQQLLSQTNNKRIKDIIEHYKINYEKLMGIKKP
jgi:uncharacterized protein YbcI